MTKPAHYIFLSLLFMAIGSGKTTAQTEIHFNVAFSEPQAHYVDVSMDIKGIKDEFVDVRMPVWAPGSYLVREFSKNVENVIASSGNTMLKVSKINKNTWRIKNPKNQVLKISYRVYAFELSVRTSFVDASHAFLSPSGIFMYVEGQIKSPVSLTIEPFGTWKKISTGLEHLTTGKSTTYYAADFDILYDSPIEIGNQDIIEFEAAGVKHEMAMYGGGNYNKQKLATDIKKIIEAETSIFKENPNKHYVFIVHNTLAGGGGLEHLNSCVLGAIRTGYATEDSYKSFLGLVAHEYFHLWNVKRLRPAALGPFDYSNENYTTNLWIAEGFTAYFDNLMLRRTGLYSPEKYIQTLIIDINTVENQPGNSIQALSDASFDAWIKYYRPNENSRNSTISYYDKGSLIAMILDLEILGATKGARRLDDVMKAMYDEYYKKQNRGYTDEEFKAMAEKIAGKPLDDIYSSYINGTQAIKFNTYLGHAGLYLVNDNAGKTIPFLGTTTVLRDGRVIITSVARGSAAWNDGLNVNDEIIAINDHRITGAADAAGASDLTKMISGMKVGDKLRVLISRDGMLQTLNITLGQNPGARYRIEIDQNASAAQLAIREKWLALP